MLSPPTLPDGFRHKVSPTGDIGVLRKPTMGEYYFQVGWNQPVLCAVKEHHLPYWIVVQTTASSREKI